MSEWKTYKLGDLPIQFIDGDRGKNYPKGEDFSEVGHCLFLNAGNVTKNGWNFSESVYISQEKDNLLRNGKLERGDIVLTTRGTIGNVVLYSNDIPYKHIRINSGMVIIRNNNTCYNLYLYQYLRSYLFLGQVQQFQSGSAQPQIPISTLKKLTISLPPLAEQKRIADILSAIDDKIELNRRINANLEQQAQVLYKSWFVDFEPFGGKMPEDWRVGTLGEICITNKRSYSGKFYNSFEYLDTGSVTSNKIDTIQLLNPTIDKIPSRARRAVTEGDILYSSVRPNQKHYMFLYNPSSNMVVSTGFIVITANWSGYRYYIYQYLIQDIVTQHLQSIAEQSVSTYPSINASDITNLEINIPSNKAIEKYANVMNPIMKQITNNQSENLRLAQLRDTLLPKLISGEIKV